MFCFAGYNAAAYVASEMEHPERDLPRALLLGTATVLVLYLGLNAVYFYGASVDELAGQVEVGLVASRSLFGPHGCEYGDDRAVRVDPGIGLGDDPGRAAGLLRSG